VSAARGFVYPLAPLLTTRRWELDARRAELGEVTARLAAQEAQADMLRAARLAGDAAWHAACGAGQTVDVSLFARLHAYGADLGGQLKACEARIVALEDERGALVGQLRLAQRALEAVEEHREKALAGHAQASMRRDFTAADDQWNSLQGRSAGNER
jgi:hypothetical protein